MNYTTVFTSRFVGIDPGLSGAVAVLHNGRLEVRRDFRCRPDISQAVKDSLTVEADVWIEKVNARPGEGVVSVFSFGRSTGTALGAVEALTDKTPKAVSPMRWQNFYRNWLGLPDVTFKELTRDVAIQLFPAHKDLFKRKKDHGTSDAVLIALYGAACGVETESP